MSSLGLLLHKWGVRDYKRIWMAEAKGKQVGLDFSGIFDRGIFVYLWDFTH